MSDVIMVSRTSNETKISLSINPESTSKASLSLPCGFLSHMLELMSFHGRLGLVLEASGDVHVDYHHLTEDIGICMGEAILTYRRRVPKITRYASEIIPMDEALTLISMDIGGRACLSFKVNFPLHCCGDFPLELVKEFLTAMCRTGGVTLHVKMIDGENSHHIVESIFKGIGRCLRRALHPDDLLPSTKGILEGVSE